MNKKFSSLPLNFRLAIASMLPLLLITIGLAGLSIQTRKSDLDHNIQLMGETRANFAAKDADVALFSGDKDALKKLLNATLSLKSTQGVMFLDSDQNLILSSRNFTMPIQSLQNLLSEGSLEEEFFYQAQPVFLSGIDFSDYASEFDETPEETLVGWVIVALDVSEQRNQYLTMIITTLLFALIVFIVAIVITYSLSRSILMPIHSLSHTVTRIKEGDLTARAKIYPHREFSLLGEVINRMAATVEEGTTNLERRVNNATARLQETLEDLQKNNHELQIARMQSEKSNQSKAQFLAKMSHELRTPITSIQGFSRLISESATNEIDKQHCQIIDQAANQLLLLIDDILDYSKLQSNTVVLNKQPFDLIDCVEQIAGQFSIAAHDKSLEFTVDISPSLTAIRRGDEKRVRQIINNLLSNAVKFTKTGGVYLTISESTEAGFVRLSVQDTGIGIKSSHRDQLFHAFSQADSSISRQYGGAGLGLSITKTLVELMEGELFFYSTLNQGSDFIADIPLEEIADFKKVKNTGKKVLVYHSGKPAFIAIQHAVARFGLSAISAEKIDTNLADYSIILYYLPPAAQLQEGFSKQLIDIRNKAADSRFIIITPVISTHNLLTADELRQLQPAIFIANPPSLAAIDRALNQENAFSPSEKPLKNSLLANLNVLIAEDNQFTCLLLETLIERYGGVFSTATNGLEAVKISQKEPFDILLIDVHMPELNGIDAIRQIRRGNGANKGTPIISLTADLQQQDKLNLERAGANEMLLKPFNENHLLEVIRKYVGRGTIIKQKLEGLNNLVSEDLYFTELHSLANIIDKAINNKDWHKVGEYIHQVLGITGIFTLHKLDEKILALHSAFKMKKYDELQNLLENARKEIPQPATTKIN